MLTSARNPQLLAIRKAGAEGRPLEDGLVVAEGPHLLAEALGSPWEIAWIFGTAAALEKHSALLRRSHAEPVTVSEPAFAATAQTETSQGILTLLRPRRWTWSDLQARSGPVIVLDGIQDPGNAGTILRSAEAFGGAGAVFLTGCVRPSNGKLQRAAAGSLFRLPFVQEVTPAGLLDHAARSGWRLYALDPRGAVGLAEANLAAPCALIAGSEGAGVSPALAAVAVSLSIPTRRVESLNAAVAASIVLFESQRQRASR